MTNMYNFHARRDGELTCRNWLSGPEGCTNPRCSYSHTITGAMAPPSIFACYAYNNGGCQFSEDECLFTHEISDPRSQYLQIRRESRQPTTNMSWAHSVHRPRPSSQRRPYCGGRCKRWLRLQQLAKAEGSH